MSRQISFALTTRQFLDGTKTVTRRKGWQHLRLGDELIAVEKAMGLKKGEHPVILGRIRVLMAWRERLEWITQDDCASEGFPDITPIEFVIMFCQHMKCKPRDWVTRIEFERLL